MRAGLNGSKIARVPLDVVALEMPAIPVPATSSSGTTMIGRNATEL
jgi:hypothetical protein